MTKPIIRYSRKSVLIIEDFSEYAYSLRGMMTSMGSQRVDLVYNGENAIQACKEHQYDIILSDYNLGDSKDGQQILEELCSFNIMKKSAVFLIITAENTREMVMGAIEFEPDSYLTKPFNTHTLKYRLDKAIHKKEIISPITNLIQKNKLKAAFKKCEQVLQKYPKFRMTCLKQQFICLKKLKEYKLALSLTTNIVNERPLPWAILGTGEIYFEQGEFKKAETVFLELINEFPVVAEGYDWLAKTQYQLGQIKQAQETLSRAVDISPKALRRQRKLGHIAEENFDFDTMAAAFRQAVKFGKHSAFSTPEEFIKLTKSIGMQLRGNSDIDRDRLIEEAKSVFIKLNQQFDADATTKFRSEVAQADFSSVTNNKKNVEKHLKAANKSYQRVEELLSANQSLEVSDSLKHLGEQEMVEMILEEAVEQHFDDPRFMKQVEKLTNNKNLLLNAKKADLLNKKATLLFSRKEYADAIKCFTKASKVAPNNVDINLNHAQALLKSFIAEKNTDYLEKADVILSRAPSLSVEDPRYQRYLELVRFSQIIQQRV